MFSSDVDHSAKFWSFVFTSFTDNDITHLSNLDPDIAAHTSFAAAADDTGKQFIQGLVCAHKHRHKVTSCHLTGDNAMCDIPETIKDLHCVVTTIQLSSFPQEFGSAKGSRIESHLKEIKEMKTTMNFASPTPSTDQLPRRFPKICLLFPLQVQRHATTFVKVNALPQKFKHAIHRSSSQTLAFRSEQSHRQ